MLALALDLWQPAIIGGAGRSQWLANLAGRFGGVTPDVYVDFTTRQAYQAGQPSVLTPDDALNCSCASTRYRDDSQGNWLSFPPNTLAYTNKGLRVWEARTNAIRNNSMGGAVVGTPGTLPTNWTATPTLGITPSVAAVGTENGIDYVDIAFIGTATGGGNIFVNFESNTVMVAANGQTWTASVFARTSGGSTANLGGAFLQVSERNNVGAQNGIATVALGNIGAATLSGNRPSISITNSNATTAYELAFITVNIAAAGAVNYTLRIGWPQLEQASFASPPIWTTGAAVTTPAEVITLKTAPVFGSAYTLYGAGVPASPTAYGNPQAIIQSDTGADAQSVALRRTNGSGTASALLTGGTGGSLVGAAWSQNAAGKLAAALNAADQAISFNGAAVVTAALAALPTTPTGAHVGGQANANQLDGDITEFAIWATQRLPNASLISGTM
jgi:hypothetical protein